MFDELVDASGDETRLNFHIRRVLERVVVRFVFRALLADEVQFRAALRLRLFRRSSRARVIVIDVSLILPSKSSQTFR